MTVGIYARVSTGMQVLEGTSLESQIDLCKKKAIELGYSDSNFNFYREEGVSGEDIDRPSINQLKDDIESGTISTIIITHPDRLSRNLNDKLQICSFFDKHEVELIFTDTEYKNTDEGKFFFNMHSVIAEYELSMIKKRTSRGRLNAVKKNHKIMPMGFSPYGYDFNNGSLETNKEEAEFVVKIFNWYIYDNLTLRQIGEKLFEQGATPKSGKSENWNVSTIKKIISSEVYVGKFFYNRRQYRKLKGQKTIGGKTKRTYKTREESEWVIVTVPSIIDVGTFELATKQRGKNLKRGGNVKYEYLLRSLLRCGHCGRLWDATFCQGKISSDGTRKKYFRYVCRNKNPALVGGEKCKVPTIKCGTLDQYVWNKIIGVINDPNLFVGKINNEAEGSITEVDRTILVLTKNLEKAEKEKEKVKIMFRRELIDEGEMFNDLRGINNGIKKISDEIEKYQLMKNSKVKDKMTQQRIVEIALQIQNFVKGKDESTLTVSDKRRIIDKFVDEIVIRVNEDGKFTLSFVGILSSVFELE